MNQLPLTVRRSIELAGLSVLALAISESRQIVMPLLMACIASIVLLPVFRFLKRNRIPEFAAILLSVVIMLIGISLIIFFISSQVKPLVNNFGQIKENITNHINVMSKWLSEKTSISTREQADFIDKQTKKFVDSAGNFVGGAAGSVGAVIVFFGLLPIYTFLIIYYRAILKKFVFHWFQPGAHAKVKDTIHKIESIIKSYIVGLLIQISYITVLLGGSLMLFGIKHAMLIGIIFAILNLIPYIGALFGNLIGVLLTLSSSPDLGPVLTVLLAIAVVQFLDNNILMPGIVGSKIKINALASLVGVFAGGALAGIPGMFLSLPVIAILKIIFDHTEQFKQWGILFGDDRQRKKITHKLIKAKVTKVE
ncbi:MAG: AI-2E family transporter [Ginsengibacter sp.]